MLKNKMSLQKFPQIVLLLVLTMAVSLTTAVEDPVCPPPKIPLSRASFPEGFLFGTASAAFQFEGAINETCRGLSIWDTFCQNPARCNGSQADVAVDFFHRYKEDIQLMKSLNTDVFRFSIAWSRIFPHGRKAKGISQAGVQFYHDLIKELRDNGITPSLTLFHWDTPQDLEDEYGGFLSEKIVKDFREYAEFVFKEYGQNVSNWITFNAPWVFARSGYDIGKKAPGRCSTSTTQVDCTDREGRSGYEAYLVSHNILLAHAEAVEVFRQLKLVPGGKVRKDAKIGIAHSPSWFEPHDLQNSKDAPTIGRVLDFMFGWHVHPTTYGDYPQIMKDVVGHRLPKFTEQQKAKLINSTDFVGIFYYTSTFSKHIEKLDPAKPSWTQDSLVDWKDENVHNLTVGSKPLTAAMAVYATGFRKLLNYIKDKYGNPEIIVVESGYGDKLGDKDSVEVGTADHNRKYYLQRHLLAMNEAICIDKVRVTGFFVWSLLDNFEWQDGFSNRFGLYYIDYKNNLTRHEKESARYFRDFLKEGVRPSAIEKIKKDEL